MSLSVVVHVLTALAALVLGATRYRLRRGAASGRAAIARGPVGVHTAAGGTALLGWVVFLAGGDGLGESTASVLGILSLLLWWIAALAGLLILARWLPVRGRHAAPVVESSALGGTLLSLLGHLGLVAGVLVFTYAYLVSAV